MFALGAALRENSMHLPFLGAIRPGTEVQEPLTRARAGGDYAVQFT
jgi:hypothetical protein